VETSSPDRDVVDATGLVPLHDDEYTVAHPPGRHRDQEIPDPVRAARSLGEELAAAINSGLDLLRATAGLGFRLVGFGRLPLALTVGPLGRAAAGPEVSSTVSPVTLRMYGEDVALDRDSLDENFPHATDRIVLFVSEAGASENIWRSERDRVGNSYGSMLAQLLDWTPVYLRIEAEAGSAEAGVAISALVQMLVENWPTEVSRIAIVGHAAGGLAIRAACGIRSIGEQPWTELVSEVVVLGTPNLVAATPRRIQFGRQFEEGLAGLTSTDRARLDVPHLEHARYLMIGDAALNARNPVGRAMGDLLWWRNTATGRRKRAYVLFPQAAQVQVATRDFPLVHHPEIQQALVEWLT
jgi:hypothetical protein